MKKLIGPLILVSSLSSFAFDECQKKENKCEARELKAQVDGYENKVSSLCDEVSYLAANGKREIAYYECKVILDSKNSASPLRIRFKPLTASESKQAGKPKFDPSKPFEVIEE